MIIFVCFGADAPAALASSIDLPLHLFVRWYVECMPIDRSQRRRHLEAYRTVPYQYVFVSQSCSNLASALRPRPPEPSETTERHSSLWRRCRARALAPMCYFRFQPVAWLANFPHVFAHRQSCATRGALHGRLPT